MPRIRQLPSNVITQIAAGEVIERPASVVKELLENSIDAGGTCIDVEVEQGGAERIMVADNGCGIEAADLPLAFASHATSKLKEADDLFRIGTLGFRGEALASIGGVAQVTLQSRPAGLETGAEIQCHAGELSAVRPWNGAPGTRIDVRHLFFNTPVRRKFLKTTSTELGHVAEMCTRLALAYPTLHLTLKHNGKEVYELPATTGLRDRISRFFGAEVGDALYEVDVERGPLRLYGFIADPSCERGSAKLQYLFLNGRWVRDRSLGYAVQEGYRGLLMTGRYAVAFLFLDVPPDHVDVNVHPTKAEVRFRDPQAMFHLVLSSVRARLNEANLVPRLQVPFQALPFDRAAELPPSPQPTGSTPGIVAESFLRAPASAATPAFSFSPSSPRRDHAGLPAGPTSGDFTSAASVHEQAGPTEESKNGASADTLSSAADAAKAIQIHDSYLVVETADGMLVIDQHALHERIIFEQFKQRMRSGTLERQRLLIPEPVDLTAEQAARALEARSELAELGVEIEEFGGTTVLIHAFPTMLERRMSPAAILREAVDFLTSQDRIPPRDVLLNNLLSMMACKAAVKAGDRLTREQIGALLEQRHLVGESHHCPHGRPTQLLFSRQELDKQFKRV
jgi:DNA mismatch repair protein MutL